MIRGVLFDFIGTIVMEKDPATINRCFKQAFADHGILVNDEFIKTNRGKDKKDVISHALREHKTAASSVNAILNSLKIHIEKSLDNFYDADGAKEIVRWCKQNGKVTGVGSGLPRDTFGKIFYHLGWDSAGFDYIGIAGEIGKGRPDPDMLLDMMAKHQLSPDNFLKVGDTVADIQEGKNANVLTVAILSGTQDEKMIREQRPDHIIRSLPELEGILLK